MTSKLPAQKIKLTNKAILLVEENHSVPMVSLAAYFKGGIRAESEPNNGITHFMQKAQQKGTEKYSAEEFAFKTENLGSAIAYFTEKDNFGFHTSLLSKHFEEALDLFLEALFRPVFPTSEVEKEREVILAEIEESRDEIYSHCQELCDRALFARHPYRLALRGESETVKALSRDDLVRWHARWCVPNNLILSIVGDVSAERIVEHTAKLIDAFPKSKPVKFETYEEDGTGKQTVDVEREKRQLAVALGFLAPSATSDDRFSFEVLNGLLSGMGARLFIELRDKKGLAYSVGSRYDAVLDYGILKAFMGTSPEQEQAAREGLLEEILKLRSETPSEEELERTKRHLIGLYEISRQKSYVRAMRYARYEMLGMGWRTANLYPKKIEAVEGQAVRRLAEQYLRSDNYSCAVIRPVKREPASVKSSSETSPS